MVQKSGEPPDISKYLITNRVFIHPSYCRISQPSVFESVYCVFLPDHLEGLMWTELVFILHRSSMKFSCDHLRDEFVKLVWLDYRSYRIHVWYIFIYKFTIQKKNSFMWVHIYIYIHIFISIPSILWGIRLNGWNYPSQPWRKVLSSKQKTASAGSC